MAARHSAQGAMASSHRPAELEPDVLTTAQLRLSAPRSAAPPAEQQLAPVPVPPAAERRELWLAALLPEPLTAAGLRTSALQSAAQGAPPAAEQESAPARARLAEWHAGPPAPERPSA